MIDAKEVAIMLGISRVTVYRLVEKGDLKAFKVGGSLRFKTDQVEKYIKDNQV